MKSIDKIKFIPVYAISILPFSVLYALSNGVFVVLFYLLKYRRGVVKANLNKSFPDKNEQEIKAIERKFYRHFSDIWFESIKAFTINKHQLKKRFLIKNPDLIQKYYNEKRSVILYAAHQGNWEMLSFLSYYLPYQLTSFYQPISNGYFEQLMRIVRERSGLICIESNKGYRSVVNLSQRNILTANIMAGDQSPQKDAAKHWVQFLNQETAFLVGAERIARKSNQVVVFPSFRKVKRGYYELEFKLIEEEPAQKNNYEIINKYAGLLEETITDSPELYLWSHKRWKLNDSNN